MLSCGRIPDGVMDNDDMAHVIADLQLADAYISANPDQYSNDSSKQALKQSIFKKHGITQRDYDSSLVWYAHNMEDYIRAYDKASRRNMTKSTSPSRSMRRNCHEGTLANPPTTPCQLQWPDWVEKNITKMPTATPPTCGKDSAATPLHRVLDVGSSPLTCRPTRGTNPATAIS